MSEIAFTLTWALYSLAALRHQHMRRRIVEQLIGCREFNRPVGTNGDRR